MTGVLVSRLARLLAVLLAVTAASFCMVSLLPGDTVTAMLGANASAEDRDAARQELRLDDPLPVRYARWVGDAVTGDLGTSYRTRQPVTEAIGQRIGVTLELVLLSQLIALAVAVPMAIFGALKPGSWLDKLLSGTQLALLATPGYLVAIGLWGCAAIGYGLSRLNWAERLWAFVAASFLVAALPWTDEIGLAATLAFVAWHLLRRRALARAVPAAGSD